MKREELLELFKGMEIDGIEDIVGKIVDMNGKEINKKQKTIDDTIAKYKDYDDLKNKINTYDGQNLGIVHCVLTYNNVTLTSKDFELAVKDAKKGDFIYFDPPYDSDTTTFNSYTEDGFGKEEQVRLARVYKELSDRGCYVMLSNHNTKLVNELYGEFNIHVIEAKRNINANGKKRGKVEEVIITNY